MAKLRVLLLFILSFQYLSNTVKSATDSSTEFIRSECGATRYPALCVRCLSNYSTTVQLSQRQLAQAALQVSLSRAQAAASFVAKLARMRGMRRTEYGAVKDCVENMGDTVAQLSRSMRELGGMGRQINGQDFKWHVSNVMTWVSAALTNANTCFDGLSGTAMDGKVKVVIRNRVLDCAQVTSNALALVNRFATRHKTANSMEDFIQTP